MEHIHFSSTRSMTTILIGIIALLLSANAVLYIVDTDKLCPVEWTDDLRNHQQRLDKCKLVSRNKYMEWVLKD